MAGFRDRLTPLGANEEPEVPDNPAATDFGSAEMEGLGAEVAPGDATPNDFRSRLAPEGEEDIGGGEALARGVATGVVRSGAVAPGMIMGGRLGAMGFAGGPVVGAVTTTVGAGIGGLAGLLFGEELNRVLAAQDVTFDDPASLPEGVRGIAAAGETFGSIATMAPAPIILAKMGVKVTSQSMAGNLINRVLETAGKTPGKFLAIEAGGASTAAVAGGASVEAFPDQPGVRLGAELLGGFFSPTRLVLGQGRNAANVLRKVVTSLGPKGRQTKAGEILQQWIDAAAEGGEDISNDALVRMINETDFAGLETTAAQKTGSKALGDLEAELMELNRPFSNEVRRQAKDSFTTITKLITALRGTGDPSALRAAANLRSTQMKTFLTTRINKGMEEANAAAAKITDDTPKARAALSKVAEGILDESVKGARKAERSLWGRVPEHIQISGEETFSKLDKVTSQMLPRKQLPKTIAGTLSDLKTARRIIEFAEAGEQVDAKTLAAAREMFTVGFFKKFRTELLDEARGLNELKKANDARILGELAESVLDDMTVGFETAPGLTSAAREAYDIARTFSREFNDVYTRTFVGATRSTTELGAARLPPELLLKRALATGEELGALRLQELTEAVEFLPKRGLGGPDAVRNVELMLDAQKRLFKLAAAASRDPLTGRVSALSLQKFINKNEELLDRFPDQIRKDLQAAVDSEMALKVIERMTPVRTTKSGEVVFSRKIEAEAAFTRILGVESAADAVRGALTSDNPLRSLVRMARVARRGGEAAVEGLRGAIWDDAIRQATNGDGTVVLGNLVQSLVGEIRPGLPSLIQVMSRQKLMRPDEIGMLRQLVQRAQTISTAIGMQATGRPLQEGTAFLIQEQGIDTLLRVAGSRVGVLFAGGQTGPSLIAAQRGSLAFRQVLGKLPKLKVQEILIGALRGDPLTPGGSRFGLLKGLLEQPQTAEEGIEFARQMHAYAFGAGLTFLTSEDEFDMVSPAQAEELPPNISIDTPEDEASDETEAKALFDLGPDTGEDEVSSEIQTKEGVALDDLQPEALSATDIAKPILEAAGVDFVVTSTGPGDRANADSVEGSKHDTGQAFDIRTRDIPEEDRQAVADQLKEALGDDHDVVLESNHIHVEFDRKSK